MGGQEGAMGMSGTGHAPRHLDWDACDNVRDLGGLATADGGRTRWRSVVRADTLARLSVGGQAALLAYGIGTIIDLRRATERAADPCPFAAHPAISYHPHPLTDERDRRIRARIAAAPSLLAQYRLVLEVGQRRIGGVMRAIAAAPAGGLLVYCHAGKDRTGLIAALLLDVAGVAREEIVADYMLSEECLAPLRAQGRVRQSAVPEAMHGALAHLDRRFGGTSAYLAAAGMSASEVRQLYHRLRT